jgi:cysteine desulfurase / selenocysteine lyase
MKTPRIYMDNAATSFPKPPAVLEAMSRYATEIGASAGRGAYREAVESAQVLAECRSRLQKLFNGELAEHFIFTLNCSDGLNLALKGLVLHQLKKGRKPHCVCTRIDHNSILRPLHAMEELGWITQTRVAIDPKSGLVNPDDLRKAVTPETCLIAITHASNVTGTLQPLRKLSQVAKEHGIPLVVDAAQSVGHVPIDVQADGVDLLAAPGHKGLLGPLGTGILYIRPGIEKIMQPLKEGGTGSVSEQPVQPEFMPDRFEPGSHNAIGIAGLSEGVKWLLDLGPQRMVAHDKELMATFVEGTTVVEIPGLKVFGPQGVPNRVGVFSVRMDGFTPHELAMVLESRYGILTRPGIHCAPLAHEAIGTLASGGTTRFSFGPFLSQGDVNYATDCLADIAICRREGRLSPAATSAAGK